MEVTSTICPLLKLGLRIYGIWPDVPFANVRRLIHLSITFLVQFFQYRYIYAICRRGELQRLGDSLPAVVYYSLTCFKEITIWKNHRIIRELLVNMKTDWHEYVKVDQHLHIMMTKANISKYCTHFLMSYNTIAGILYFGGDNLVALLHKLQGYNITSPKPFPVKLLLPFDAEQTPVYELFVIFLFLHSLSIKYMVNIVSSMVLTLVFHTCGQMEIIGQELKANSGGIHHHGTATYTTRMLIGRHNKVISFSENIDKLFSYIALVQVFGNTIVVCFLGLVVMISHTIDIVDLLKFFAAYLGITLEIFIFCFVGEYIGAKSRSLGDAGYDSSWYNMLPCHSKNILFIIMRSQKQLTISAGGMADLSLEAFTSIMKASASYMSVLNAMY